MCIFVVGATGTRLREGREEERQGREGMGTTESERIEGRRKEHYFSGTFPSSLSKVISERKQNSLR